MNKDQWHKDSIIKISKANQNLYKIYNQEHRLLITVKQPKVKSKIMQINFNNILTKYYISTITQNKNYKNNY